MKNKNYKHNDKSENTLTTQTKQEKGMYILETDYLLLIGQNICQSRHTGRKKK